MLSDNKINNILNKLFKNQQFKFVRKPNSILKINPDKNGIIVLGGMSYKFIPKFMDQKSLYAAKYKIIYGCFGALEISPYKTIITGKMTNINPRGPALEVTITRFVKIIHENEFIYFPIG